MWIRCPKCGRSTRAAFNVALGVNCVSCGHYSSLEKAKKLGATPQERFQIALGFARVHRVDLASAYSILLGIIPFDQALSIPGSFDYDPGFREAVERGFLTPEQAFARGDRPLYATTIALNHSLDMKTAFLIADNRMQLADAFQGMIEPDSPDLPVPPATRAVWSTVRTAGALATVAVMVFTLFPSSRTPVNSASMAAPPSTSPGAEPGSSSDSSRPAPKNSGAVFRTDEEGRVTEVSGPDPKVVLSELCAHEQFIQNLSPVALAPAVPASAGTRLGLVRDMRNLSGTRCVAIHRDPNSGRWVVGDGLNPIETQEAPYLPPETIITPM
jgi:hypothetical protein